MSLGGPVLAAQLKKGNLLQPVDFSKIPNVKNVAKHFRDAYPWGPPTDFGKTGFGYRKDLISERPTSWADLWTLAKKYSGKVTLLDFDVDILGMALKYKGYSINSANEKELNAARDALLELKPHVQAFLPDRFREAAAEGDGGDRGRLRLRHRARPAEEQEHRVGVAVRGDARLPRWMARRRGDEEPARGRAVHELPARAQGLRRLHQQHRLRVRDAGRPRSTSTRRS